MRAGATVRVTNPECGLDRPMIGRIGAVVRVVKYRGRELITVRFAGDRIRYKFRPEEIELVDIENLIKAAEEAGL